MKIKIDGYEVNIEARALFKEEEEMNERDTKAFITKMALWAYDAGEKADLDGYHGIAWACNEAYKRLCDSIS